MICIKIKIIPSKGRIPANEWVNILDKVTCGLANMVEEVDKMLAPTNNGIINEALFVLFFERMRMVKISIKVTTISEK